MLVGQTGLKLKKPLMPEPICRSFMWDLQLLELKQNDRCGKWTFLIAEIYLHGLKTTAQGTVSVKVIGKM